MASAPTGVGRPASPGSPSTTGSRPGPSAKLRALLPGPPPASGAATATGATGARPRPNKALLVVLGVLLLAAVLRFGLPALTAGGSSPTRPITRTAAPRHLVPRGATGVTQTAPVVAASRPARNPFSPPPGYGR